MFSKLTQLYCWTILVPSPAQVFFYPLFSANFLVIHLLSMEILTVFKMLCTYGLSSLCVPMSVLSLHTLRVRYGKPSSLVGMQVYDNREHAEVDWHSSVSILSSTGSPQVCCNTQQILSLQRHSSKWEKHVASSQVFTSFLLLPWMPHDSELFSWVLISRISVTKIHLERCRIDWWC